MGKKLWLHPSGQARVDRRGPDRADASLNRVHEAGRLLKMQTRHACEDDLDADGLCSHDRDAVLQASRLLSPALSLVG